MMEGEIVTGRAATEGRGGGGREEKEGRREKGKGQGGESRVAKG